MDKVTLAIGNTKTWIYGADSFLLEKIDTATSYVDSKLLDTKEIRKFLYAKGEEDNFGVIHLMSRDSYPPSIPSGLRDIVISVLSNLGVSLEVRDIRQPPSTFLERSYPPIPLWDHQQEAKKALISQPDCVVAIPPRGGKTRTLLETVRELSLPTIWIAPTSSIVSQTVKAAKQWFTEEDVVEVNSRNWEENKDALITICTAAGMLKLPTDFFLTRQMLVCDESHHLPVNKAWGKKLAANTAHIYHRKGMSGTYFRSSGDDLSLLAFIGRIGYSISSQLLMDKGYLVPTYTAFVPIDGPKIKYGDIHGDFLAKNGIGGLGIQNHEHRNDVVSATAKHLLDLGRTVIILVSTKAQGYEIQKRLEATIPCPANAEFKPVEFVSTDRKKPLIQKIFSSFSNRQEVKVLIGTSMVGEGVDLPIADALIYAAGRKASVQYLQSLYRVCTASEGKTFGVVVDFVDKQHKTLLEHSRVRWKVASSDPVFKLAHLPSLESFPDWAKNAFVEKVDTKV